MLVLYVRERETNVLKALDSQVETLQKTVRDFNIIKAKTAEVLKVANTDTTIESHLLYPV